MWHKLLQMQFAPNPREVLEWMLSQGVGQTITAYGGSIEDGRTAAKLGAVAMSRWTNHLRAKMREADGHERLMHVLRRAAYTRDGTVLFVNAGSRSAASLGAAEQFLLVGKSRLRGAGKSVRRLPTCRSRRRTRAGAA